MEVTWIAYGWRGQDSTWLAVWRREPTAEERGEEVRRPRDPYRSEDLDRSEDSHKVDESARTTPIPHLRGTHLHPAPLYPGTSDATADWDAAEARFAGSLPRHDTAVLLRLDVAPPA